MFLQLKKVKKKMMGLPSNHYSIFKYTLYTPYKDCDSEHTSRTSRLQVNVNMKCVLCDDVTDVELMDVHRMFVQGVLLRAELHVRL